MFQNFTFKSVVNIFIFSLLNLKSVNFFIILLHKKLILIKFPMQNSISRFFLDIFMFISFHLIPPTLPFLLFHFPLSFLCKYFRRQNMEVLQHRSGITQRIHERNIGRIYPQSRLSQILLGSQGMPLEDYSSSTAENTAHYFRYIPRR